MVTETRLSMTRTYISGLFSLRFTFSALFFYFYFYYQVHQTFYNNIDFFFYFQVLNLLHSFLLSHLFPSIRLLEQFFLLFNLLIPRQGVGRGLQECTLSVCLSATLMVLPYNLVTRIKAILWTCFKVKGPSQFVLLFSSIWPFSIFFTFPFM